MPGVSIKNFASASGGVFYNNGLPYDATGALLVNGSTTVESTFAGLPAASSVPGEVYLATDLGVGGILLRSNGVSWRPLGGDAYLKVLATEITNNGAPLVVMDSCRIPAGLILDNDRLEIIVDKTASAGTDTDVSTLYHGAAAATVGTSLLLTNGSLTGGALNLCFCYRVKKVSATSLKPISIPGGVGFGSSTVAATTVTGLTNMDTTDSYLQIGSDLTTAAGVIVTLTEFSVRWIAGS